MRIVSDRAPRHRRRGGVCLWLWGTMVVGSWGADPQTTAWRRVEFREPRPSVYYVAASAQRAELSSLKSDWTPAWRGWGSTNVVALGSRIALQVQPGFDVGRLLPGRPLSLARSIRPDLVILQAASSAVAIDQAEGLAQQPGVVASYPIMRRAARLQGRYSQAPNDPYFPRQWHLENRNTNGLPQGLDLNVRSAWSTTLGQGVLVALGDDGIEFTHPDLAAAVANQPHFNFDTMTTNGAPETVSAAHATAVAGVIAAQANNGLGVAGVAPQASLASWVIFASSGFSQETIVSNEALMDMFQYASNRVSIQNHSWADTSGMLSGIDALSEIGLSNAVSLGRGGRGIVMIRACGNDRESLFNANDDAFTGDPRAIAVAAARFDGKTCSYSTPGACVLLAAPSGNPFPGGGEDPTAPNIVTTDRQGSAGYNTAGPGDSADYAFGQTGFAGTSAASPMVAGVAALVLAANTNLGYRDVQQVLLQSARHHDLGEAALQTNGAGFLVSHDQGYGVPDAGLAVALARHWVNRASAKRVGVEATNSVTIPTNALQLVCGGPGIPAPLAAIRCRPDLGPQADDPTPTVPLVYVGQANADLTVDLHGKAALIQRGVSFFSDKITRAAKAGAAFAVIFNNANQTELILMAGTSFVPIPAVFINQNDGEALRNYVLAQPDNTAQIRLTPATVAFTVKDTLSCEHVGVELKTTTTSRGDLRITLVSPAGTRSVLQAISDDTSPDPADWTYWSVQHFYESSVGQWRLEISNERSADSDTLNYAKLLIDGVPITDTDHDGLDDNWELKWFGTLAYGAKDNPSGDGYSNARKQCLDLDPTRFAPLFGPDLSFWNDHLVRVSFPADAHHNYQILASPDAGQPFTVLTNLTGHLPEVDLVVPYLGGANQFFQARQAQPALSAGTNQP